MVGRVLTLPVSVPVVVGVVKAVGATTTVLKAANSIKRAIDVRNENYLRSTSATVT